MIFNVQINDLEEVINIMENIKNEMRKEHNPQWGSTEDDYPSEDDLRYDITQNNMYKYVEDGIIKGLVTLNHDTKEYDELIENSSKKAYIIHRLAVPKEYRNIGVATKLMDFIENKAEKEHIEVLKSDTEISNDKMNRLFLKLGYVYKGQFVYDDYPGKYNYYEKSI